MLRYNHFIFLLAAILVACCSTKRKSQGNLTEENSKEQYPLAELGDYAHSDPVKIKSVYMYKRNIIAIEVTYSGGCEQHEFRLIGNKTLTKSIPPARSVQLVHDSRGDRCKALQTETLKFSITPLAEHTEPGNKAILQFENYDKPFEYSYE